jgi:hypothetical protein
MSILYIKEEISMKEKKINNLIDKISKNLDELILPFETKELTPKEALEYLEKQNEFLLCDNKFEDNVKTISQALTRLDELEEEINRIIRNAESKIKSNDEERKISTWPVDRYKLLGENMQLANMIVNLRVALMSGDNKPLQNESGE